MEEEATDTGLHMRGLLPSWVGPSERPAYLEVSKGGKLLTSLSLDTAPIVSLGRSAEKVTLCLDHPSISRLHALVVHHPRLNSYFLIDCGSQHGTFVDGKRIEPKVPIRISDGIEPSDQITFGGSSRSYVLKCSPPEPDREGRRSPHGGPLSEAQAQRASSHSGHSDSEGGSSHGRNTPVAHGRDTPVPANALLPAHLDTSPSLATATSLSRLVLEKDHFSDDCTTVETASTTTAETASTLSVDDAQSVGSAELDTLSVMSSASAGSLADLDFATFNTSSVHSYEARTRSSSRGKKRKRVSWNDDVTEIPPLWECDSSGRFAQAVHTTTHSLSREPSHRPSKHHHSSSRSRRSDSARRMHSRSDSTRRSAHTFFGARYVPTQPPTLESLGRRSDDRDRHSAQGGGGLLGEGGLTPSPICGLPAPVGGLTRDPDGSGSGAASPLALVGSPARAHHHVPTPLAGSPLLEEDDDDTPEMGIGTDSSREPSVCQSEAESEGQASEAGESSEALTDITETDEKPPHDIKLADEDEDDEPPAKRRSSRGRPRMRLPSPPPVRRMPSPPPPTPAELEAQWGSLPCDSGSDGESLVDDRRQREVRQKADSANRRLAEERERGGGNSDGGGGHSDGGGVGGHSLGDPPALVAAPHVAPVTPHVTHVTPQHVPPHHVAAPHVPGHVAPHVPPHVHVAPHVPSAHVPPSRDRHGHEKGQRRSPPKEGQRRSPPTGKASLKRERPD